MVRKYIFSDEAGCFNFSRHPKASKYFILTTLTCESCADLGSELLNLRRELVWEKAPVGEYFHASEDKQEIRDRVFELLRKHKFEIQVSIFEKSKAMPKTRITNELFFQYAWYFHLQYAAPKFVADAKEFQINSASIGTQKGQAHFSIAVNNVAQQVIKEGRSFKTNFSRAIADPCLQAVDYCAWALQRKWERGDMRPFDLIKDKITHEFDVWSHGTKHYY